MSDEYNSDYDPTNEDQSNEDYPEGRGSHPYIFPIGMWASKPPKPGDDDIETPWNLKIRLIGTPPTTSFENYEDDTIKSKINSAMHFLLIPNKDAKVDPEFLYNLMTSDLLFRFILTANFGQCHYISDSNTDARIMMNENTILGVFVVYTGLRPERLDIPHMYSHEECQFSDPNYRVPSIIYIKQNLSYPIPALSTTISVMPQDGFTNDLADTGDIVTFWNYFIRERVLGMMKAAMSWSEDPFFDVKFNENNEGRNVLAWINVYSIMFGYGISMHLYNNYNANYTDLEIRIDHIYGYRVKKIAKDELILGKNLIMPTVRIPETLKAIGNTLALSNIHSLPQMVYIPIDIRYRNFEHHASEFFHHYDIDYKYLRLLHTNYYQEDALERMVEGIPYQFGQGMIYFIPETSFDIAFTNGPNRHFLGLVGVNFDFVDKECKTPEGISKYIEKRFNDNFIDVMLSSKVMQYGYFLVMSTSRTITRMKWKFRKSKLNEIELIKRAQTIEEHYANQKDDDIANDTSNR